MANPEKKYLPQDEVERILGLGLHPDAKVLVIEPEGDEDTGVFIVDSRGTNQSVWGDNSPKLVALDETED